MGTNYYLEKKIEPIDDPIIKQFCLQQEDIQIHVGKSSYGWKFLFQGSKVTSWGQWQLTIACAITQGWKLVDEYGREHTLKGFGEFIECKQEDQHHMSTGEAYWTDPGGYDFCNTEFF